MGTQIWPCREKGQRSTCNHHMIKLVELESPMLYTKIQPQNFPDGGCGSHLGFLIGKISYTFDLKSFCCYNVSNQNHPMVQEQTSKINFQDGSCADHFGFPVSTILVISTPTFLYLLVGLLLHDTGKFRLNLQSGLQEIENRFSRWLLWCLSWISNWYNFSYFRSKGHSLFCYSVSFNSNRPTVWEEKPYIGFQDGGYGGHFEFPMA